MVSSLLLVAAARAGRRASYDNTSGISAAGIDRPLYWSLRGGRRSDAQMRRPIGRLGAPNPPGTVQSPNSLRGACLVQGALTVHLLREADCDLRITESLPKSAALAARHRDAAAPRARRCDGGSGRALLACDAPSCDHERDAALGALTALAMVERWTGWRDLSLDEDDVYFPAGRVEYWMPLGARAQE